MQILLGIFLFMFTSAVLMVGYVWIRDIKHKKLVPAKIAGAEDDFFEEIQPAEPILTEYDYRQKTA